MTAFLDRSSGDGRFSDARHEYVQNVALLRDDGMAFSATKERR